MTPRVYDNDGLALTRNAEGCELHAYWDATGKRWTVGVGHTGPDVVSGLVWTQQTANDALLNDIHWASNVVNRLVVPDISQHAFDALVDFCFNEGSGNFASSTLLKLVNKGDMADADLEFKKWVSSGGKILGGLVSRRLAEAQMFLS